VCLCFACKNIFSKAGGDKVHNCTNCAQEIKDRRSVMWLRMLNIPFECKKCGDTFISRKVFPTKLTCKKCHGTAVCMLPEDIGKLGKELHDLWANPTDYQRVQSIYEILVDVSKKGRRMYLDWNAGSDNESNDSYESHEEEEGEGEEEEEEEEEVTNSVEIEKNITPPTPSTRTQVEIVDKLHKLKELFTIVENIVGMLQKKLVARTELGQVYYQLYNVADSNVIEIGQRVKYIRGALELKQMTFQAFEKFLLN
jgi:hypothetical protein